MRKEYRYAISGVVGGIGGAVLIYILSGEFPWVYLFIVPTLTFLLHLALDKRREARGIELDV